MFTSRVPRLPRLTPFSIRYLLFLSRLFMDKDEDVFVAFVHVELFAGVFFKKDTVGRELFESEDVANLVFGVYDFVVQILDFPVEFTVRAQRVVGYKEEVDHEENAGGDVQYQEKVASWFLGSLFHSVVLSGVVYGTGFADDSDLDLARIGHLVLDFLGEVH